jgi:hypothetical protein
MLRRASESITNQVTLQSACNSVRFNAIRELYKKQKYNSKHVCPIGLSTAVTMLPASSVL